MRPLLLRFTVWEVKGARNGKSVHDCITILITNKNPYLRPLLLRITVWEVKGARNGKTVHD